MSSFYLVNNDQFLAQMETSLVALLIDFHYLLV